VPEVEPNGEADPTPECRPEVSLSIISVTFFFASFPFFRRQNPFCSRFLTSFHQRRTESTYRSDVVLTFVLFVRGLSLFFLSFSLTSYRDLKSDGVTDEVLKVLCFCNEADLVP
jgi:hypothetical protein